MILGVSCLAPVSVVNAGSSPAIAWQQVSSGASVLSLSSFWIESHDRRPAQLDGVGASPEKWMAGFLISGSPHQAFSILLPDGGEVSRTEEPVLTWFSDLSGEVLLPSDGRLVLIVTAVRHPAPVEVIEATRGSFLVTAVY
jgi:hypothetical protein